MEYQLSLSDPIRPREPDERVPLTANQLRMWNQLIKLERPLKQRTCASAVRICGSLDLWRLQESIQAVVQRHESLRTRFTTIDDGPWQQVDSASKGHLELVDLSNSTTSNKEHEAKDIAQEFLDEMIDLTVGPLFFAKLLRISDQEHVLILALDHIVADGISYGILTREVWESYSWCQVGSMLKLPPLSVQFADYAIWQKRTLFDWKRRHEEYWVNRLSGAPRTVVPSDVGLETALQSNAATLSFPFGEVLSSSLRAVARVEGAPLSLLVLSIYVVAISRWLSQSDLVITFVSHGRHRSDLVNMIGYIVNYKFIRIAIDPAEHFRDLLYRVKSEVSSALEHPDFDRVLDLIPECASEVLFNWQPANSTKGPIDHHMIPEFAVRMGSESASTYWRDRRIAGPELKMQPFPVRSSVAKFLPVFHDTTTGIHLSVLYAPNLLSASYIRRLAQELLSIAEQVATDPRSRVTGVRAR